MGGSGCTGIDWVWLGVSCEDQQRADERIPLLLQCPAAVRFVSAEPLLGPLNLEQYVWPSCIASREEHEREQDGGMFCDERSLDWVIVGGESGPGARPCDVKWIRSIVRQCQDAGIACFVKQLGARYVDAANGIGGAACKPPQEVPTIRKLRDRKGGNQHEMPHDLRIREFPR